MAVGALRLNSSPERLGPWGLRIAVVLLALALVVGLSARPLWLSAITVGLIMLLAMALDRRVVVPIIILALPLEISKQVFPFLHTSASITSPTLSVSIIDFGRLAVLVAGGIWLTTAREDWLDSLPRSELYLPLLMLLAVYALSITYSLDPAGGGRELLRLVANMGLFLLIILYVQERRTLRWALIVLVGSGLALGLIGLFQQATNTYLWNEALARSGRVNATFVDPNNYARFLNIAIIMSVALLPGARGRTRYLLYGTLAVGVLALLGTASRSGWIVAALALAFLGLYMPMAPRLRFRYYALGGLGFFLALLMAAVLGSELFNRLESLTHSLRAIGPRYYLIQAGWQMFLDNPIAGLGLDSFREAMEGDYRHFIWPGRKTVLSHTSVITIMAELGLVGLITLAFLLYKWARVCWRCYAGAGPGDKALAAGLAAAFLAVFLSSQSEGRFFEDPYLWLIFGLGVALRHIQTREHAEPGLEPEPATGGAA